ncbi:rhodanese-like domain-containing protein [Paenimyroides viscosum]|uniref:Rhodanese-like domain-containing protein n=1 Tax=Paenimyroides viscosum TaxID=2488729 RepID=A0A3P1AJW0_9FLAO|nr:rhodanese-like domain-containing protein [Paenimyroides viscosum]RRA89301.1 rhodanese-like domain-containing protein [Paenimyroides viscosum]
MKKTILILGILLSGLSVNAQEIEADRQRIDVNAFINKTSKTPILIDVRTPEEYREGTIPGAMSLNIHSDDFKRSADNLPKEREIIVFCQSGDRSNEAFEMLKSLGFKNVSQLVGGYEVWREANEKRGNK